MRKKELKFSLILVVSIFFLFILGYSLHFFMSSTVTISEPIHSTIESIGALAALMMGILLLQRINIEGLYNAALLRKLNIENRYNLTWMLIGLITLGIYDAFHAIVSPGNSFVLLHSLSVFLGGVFFSFMWFPSSKKIFDHKNKIICLVAISSILISIWITLSPESIPRMVDNGKFTFLAIFLNVFGGVLFILGSIFLLRVYYSSSEKEFYWFSAFSAFLALGGIFFMYGNIWATEWWVWHIFRLTAFLIVLSLVFINFQKYILNMKKEFTERVKAETGKIAIQKKVFLDSKLISLGRLAEGKGHEINNPLTIIQGYAEKLSINCRNSDDKDSLTRINMSIKRISEIVNNLRLYARTDLGFDEVINIHDIINNTLSLIESIYIREKCNYQQRIYKLKSCCKG